MRFHSSSIAPATPHIMSVSTLLSQLPMCSEDARPGSPPIRTVQPAAPALPPLLQPTCCAPIKCDLHFADSLATVVSQHDCQTSSTASLRCDIRLTCLGLRKQASERDEGVLAARRRVHIQHITVELCDCVRAACLHSPGDGCTTYLHFSLT